MKFFEDKYNGLILDTTSIPELNDDFRKEVLEIVETNKNKNLLWIKIPIERATLIPILADIGFEFHHCDERSIMLVKKIASNSLVPTTKNYIVGVGVIVISENNLLVVKDKMYKGYKLPGGYIDKDETIKNAVKREVFEETGVEVNFESIANIGHFRNGQFGESNLYIVCTAKALSTEIHINDISEIQDARWMCINNFLNLPDVNNYNKSVVKAAISNKELKLTEQNIKLRISGGEVFF